MPFQSGKTSVWFAVRVMILPIFCWPNLTCASTRSREQAWPVMAKQSANHPTTEDSISNDLASTKPAAYAKVGKRVFLFILRFVFLSACSSPLLRP